MKQLWILRHAKSDMGHAGLPDIERTLNNQGIETASAMGRWLSSKGVNPDLLICSPALRARQTAELVSAGIGYPVGRIRSEDEIYEATPETLLDVIAQTDPDISSLMLIGHNPGLSMLVNMLGAEVGNGLSTCSVASMGFNSRDWSLLCHQPVNEVIWRSDEVLAGN